MSEAPVLIAGGGPVGMVAALLLARWGVAVVILEAATGRSAIGSRSICVQRDALDIYHRVGVADALVARGVTWHTGRTFYRGRELSRFTFPVRGSGYPGFINISQTEVEQALEAEIRAQPRIDLRYGHELVALHHDGDGVSVDARTATGTVRLDGTHLIGADGARSAVRELLGLDFAGVSFDDRFLIADIRARMSHGIERHFHFDPSWNPGRQVLVHPQPDSIWRIDWQVPPDYDVDTDRRDGGLDERIRLIVGTGDYEIVWLSVYRFHQRKASAMRVGRVLLAGDAAHLMAPFGARGLNSGVQDAENAAWKIAFDRSGWAGRDLLASYEFERGAAAVENLRVTGATMRFLCPRDDAERSHRRRTLDAAARDPAARDPVARDPAAQDGVDSGKLAEPFWYIDSPLTTGTPPVDFPREASTARPPVAGVLCPDGPVYVAGSTAGRLRELFGHGFVVLSGTGVDVDASADASRPAVATYRLDEIDRDGTVTAALEAGPGWAAVVRPDGHLAAILDRPGWSEVGEAIDRARGVTSPG